MTDAAGVAPSPLPGAVLVPTQPGEQPEKSSKIVAEEADTPITPDHYIFVDRLRLVRPYHFDFKCHVKKRWEGKRLVDVFAEEFPMMTPVYYHRAYATGRLRVESVEGRPLKGPPVTLDSPVWVGMCIRHLVHRHEPPVVATPVQVLHVLPDWVAVCKPAGMPVHTVGQYRKNTLLGVLQAEHPALGALHPTYRLDKPVSGLMVLARSSDAASRMRGVLEERACEKVYVARVQGCFPASETELAVTPVAHDPHVKVVRGDADAEAFDDLPAPADAAGRVAPAAAPGGAAATNDSNPTAPSEACDAAGGSAQGPAALSAQPQPHEAVHGGLVLEVDVPLSWCIKTNYATAVPSHGPRQGAPQQPQRGQVGADEGGGGGGVRSSGTGTGSSGGGAGTGSGAGAGKKKARHKGRGKGGGGATAAGGEEGEEGGVQARPAKTRFRLLRALPDGTSLVECSPLTGRTHQIRVHLQYLGFPIANDTQYGGLWGRPLAFRRLREEQQRRLDSKLQQEEQQQQQQGQQGEMQGTPPDPQQALRQRPPGPSEAPAVLPLPLVPQPPAQLPAPVGLPHAAEPPADQHVGMQQGGSGRGAGGDGPAGQEATPGLASAAPGVSADGLEEPSVTSPASKRQRHGWDGGSAGQPGAPLPLHAQQTAGPVHISRAQRTLPQASPEPGEQLGPRHGSPGPEAAPVGGAAALPKGLHVSSLARELVFGLGAEAQAALLGGGCEALSPEVRALYLDPQYQVEPSLRDQVCAHCPNLVPHGYPIDLDQLWLHALKYKCIEWAFESSLPAWALDP